MSFFGNMNYNELSEVDRAVYHYLTRHSDKIPYMRVREIADEAHVSASSVMRFIRKLGYESFVEFRFQFKVEDGQTNSLEVGPKILDSKNFSKDIEQKLERVAEKILLSENVIFLGLGSSGSLCEYGARRLAMLGFNTYPLTDPTYPILSKLRNTSDNVLITLSISGKTTEIIEVVNSFSHEPDSMTVAITSDVTSPLATMSDYTLDYKVKRFRRNNHDDYTTQIPSMYLIELLAGKVADLLE